MLRTFARAVVISGAWMGAVMPEDLELFALLCRDVADRPTSSSLESEQARLLREDFEAYLQSADSYLVRTMLRGRPARSAQEEHLRRCMIDFLTAVLG